MPRRADDGVWVEGHTPVRTDRMHWAQGFIAIRTGWLGMSRDLTLVFKISGKLKPKCKA